MFQMERNRRMRMNFSMSMLSGAVVLLASVWAQALAQADSQAEARMARYNVVWNSPSKDCTGVMPVGNGDLAAGVYAIENGDLYLLLAKNDTLSYEGSNYKTGRLRVSLQPNPFASGKPFRQTLDLPTGSIRIEADGVKLRIWADANRSLYHVEIESPGELAVSARPEFWKRFTGWGGPDDGPPDVQIPRAHDLLWYHSNGDHSFYWFPMKGEKLEPVEQVVPDLYRFHTFGNLVKMETANSGQLAVGRGKAEGGVLTGKGTRFDIRIHSLTMQTPDTNVWIKAVEELAAKPVDLEKDWERHCSWWRSFWDRGWIVASDRTVPAGERERFNGEANAKGTREEKDGAALVAQSYNFFRFAMGAQSRGRFQVRFNGGTFTQQYYCRSKDVEYMRKYQPGFAQLADNLWLPHPDYRAWGGRFTAQNQRLLYWPLLMSGDFDLMKPFFDHYWNVLEIRKIVTRKHFGHGGAFYLDNTCPVTGCTGLPPKTKPGEKYEGDYHDYYFTSGIEAVAMMADYVNYTGDTKFRDERLVPFAREILLFYDQHYLRDARGKLRFDPSQALETWWITVNPAPEVAGLRFCLDQLLAMKSGTAEDQSNWKRLRSEMPDVPLQKIQGRLALAPAQEWQKQSNGENAEIYPLFPFRCYGLAFGTKEVAEWTMQHRTAKDTFGGTCWAQDEIGWAVAGNAKEAAKGLVRRFRVASPSLRFPVYGCEGADAVPDWDHFGSGSIALQRMLAQEGNGKIFLLPAWPSEWDVDFKLHLSGGTVVSGTVKDGKLRAWDVVPAKRKADVVISEPIEIQTKLSGDKQ